ncbi:MAG: GAF domain-containing protein [Chloroflexi bacterium]|nr:GAF domain-containing protein [Chloroflexota bacterium]
MVKNLRKILIIQKVDLPWIRPLLDTLLNSVVILASTAVGVNLIIAFLQMTTSNPASTALLRGFEAFLFSAIIYGLLKRSQQERSVQTVSQTINLLLFVIVVFITLLVPLGLLITGPMFILYALPITAAALLLTPNASLFWAMITTLALMVRALVTADNLVDIIGPIVVLQDVVFLFLIAVASRVISLSFWRTRRALRRQIQQGRTGIEIGRTISASLDPSSIIRQAVQLICDAFDFYHVGLFTLNSDSDMAVLVDAAGHASDDIKQRSLPVPLIGTTVVATAIKQKHQQVVVTWKESRDSHGQPIRFTYDRFLSRMELAIPLQVGEQILGVLDIHSTGVDPFSEEDVHTLEGLAGLIANAIESSRLLDDVQQRHQELEAAHIQTERRARYLETTAELARAISSLFDPQALLDRAVNLISESLGIYHAGVFLVDEKGEWAVLTAATSSSEGGRRMLAREHKLRVGTQGIIGWTTHVGEPRIALDVGEDAVYFDNPDLRNTRSEMGLPLKIGDRIIGALDVQSTQASAFGQDDIAVLQILADQIAVAIENARLFQGTQRALEEVEEVQRSYVAQQWERISQRQANLNAEYHSRSVPSLDVDWTPEMKMAVDQEIPVILPDLTAVTWDGNGQNGGEDDLDFSSMDARSALVVPIKWRDEVIGVLDLQEVNEQRHWSQEDIEITTAVADQLALALENARLFEETQQRAAQLATASEVARESTSILDADQLLRETVDLISEQFNFYHAGVFLLDDQKEYAVLHAASSEGGKRMLARGYKLPVGKIGIVGYVSDTGESRVALDVGHDAMHFVNPDLPDTRSELGLPLKVREEVIGVLDVQSTEEMAFSDEDVKVLQTLTDQLAGAIANARLFQEVRADATRRALINEVQQAATASLDPNELLHQAGEVISRRLERPSAVFIWEAEERNLCPVAVHDRQGDDVPLPEDLRVTRVMNPTLFSKVIDRHNITVLTAPIQYQTQPTTELAEHVGIETGVYVPLVVRGQVLGVLAIAQFDKDSMKDQDFIEIIGTNLSVALESARLFQEAVETAEELQEMDRLKNQFLANMSHELRTPLNSIIGFSRVILKGIDGPLTDMQRTDLEAVYNSGQHLLELINGILDIAKIQAGKMELAFEDTKLHEVVKVVISTAKALVKDKPVELQQSIPQDLPIIRADPRRVRQILTNLVGNASKFTEEGFIRVGVKETPTEVIIAVKDSGIGIPEDKIDTIFEEFTQVDGSSTRAIGGTGLGLSITKHFVDMHGGRIWVNSIVDKGSTFYVALPIAGPPDEVLEEEEAISEQVVEKLVEKPSQAEQKSELPDQKTVLCVDDDNGVIMLFRRYLSKQGYQVIGHTESTTVLEKARQIKPFAITLDVMMPEKDGWQVIQELKTDPETKDIPVIMCSIVADQDHGVSLGASDYLVKPIIERELISALARLDKKDSLPHRVLIVDDQKEDRKLLRRMVESQDGYEVIEAIGGKEAIDLIKKAQPDVIILDLMMPEIDGFAVLESVKMNKDTRAIPVIVVTAKTLTHEERSTLNKGVEALLQKGIFEQQELLADVSTALKQMEATGRK